MTATPSLPPNVQFVYNGTDCGFVIGSLNNSDAGNYTFSVRAYDLIGGSTDFASVNITVNITENKSPTVVSISNTNVFAHKDL